MNKPTDQEIIEALVRDVMGWEILKWPSSMEDRSAHNVAVLNHKGGYVQEPFNPLESWADAGMVLDELALQMVYAEIKYGTGGVAAKVPGGPWRTAPKLPRAICEAAYFDYCMVVAEKAAKE